MKNKNRLFALWLLFTFSVSGALAQSNPQLPHELETLRSTTSDQLQLIDEAIEASPDNDDSFLPALLLPTGFAMTSEFLLTAATMSFISVKLYQDLSGDLEVVRTSSRSDSSKLQRLREIFSFAENAALKTLSNVEKLRTVDGYDDAALEALATAIGTKGRQCSNKENNNSPEAFCPDYKENFAREGYTFEKSGKGWKVYNSKGKLQCCLEWDPLHCGFEIFDKKGRHKGEVGCLRDEYNPCDNNMARGKHARPQKDHTPRSWACSK